MRVRTYGTSGPLVIVLHGGPGAPGHMAAVARGLADAFRVIEPFERASGPEPLTVSLHIADLHALILERAGGTRPALVGSSWGAMLALAYAAKHPEAAGPLVLIGCGTFDPAARARMRATLDERREQPGALMQLYSYDPVTDEDGSEEFDARGHQETWDDMLRLQNEGVYPARFSAIRSPVLMLHGAFDPHPGRMIRASLEPHLPQLEFREWERCGHYPWLERSVREEFFDVLREWLSRYRASGEWKADRDSESGSQ
jgi:pimeloyl-ACP methyl ester carboxylesterase